MICGMRHAKSKLTHALDRISTPVVDNGYDGVQTTSDASMERC